MPQLPNHVDRLMANRRLTYGLHGEGLRARSSDRRPDDVLVRGRLTEQWSSQLTVQQPGSAQHTRPAALVVQ